MPNFLHNKKIPPSIFYLLYHFFKINSSKIPRRTKGKISKMEFGRKIKTRSKNPVFIFLFSFYYWVGRYGAQAGTCPKAVRAA